MAPPPFTATFAEDIGTEVVDIYVGPERKHYVVHKNLLTTKSEYFNKALTGSFLEADEQSIHLKEEDPAAVALLIGWLYRGVIPGTESHTTPFAKSIFTEPVKVPVSEQGTTVFAFNPAPMPAPHSNGGLFAGSNSTTETFQHICQQSQYAIFSPEELRLADYKQNRRYQDDAPATPPTIVAPSAPPALPIQATGPFGTNAPPLFPSLFANHSTQVSQGQAASSSLFGSLAQPSHQPAQNMFARIHNPTLPMSVSTASSTPNISIGLNNSATRPPNSNIFGNSGSPAPSTNQTTNIFAHLSNSSSGPPSSSQFRSTGQPMNTFAASQAPAGSTVGSNLFGGAAPSANQTQNSSVLANNSILGPAPPSTGGGLFRLSSSPFVNPIQNPQTGVNNPSGQAASLLQPIGGLFGGLSQLANTTQNPPTRGPFGGFGSVPPATQNSPASYTNLVSQWIPPATSGGAGGGLFGNPRPAPLGQNSLFGSRQWLAPSLPVSLGSSGNGNHFSICEPGAILPPGASIMTSVSQEPQTRADFGYYPAIKYMKTPRQFIEGIPQSDPADEQFIDLEKQQLSLLNLCILAETMCWAALFNDTINAYIRGEHKLQRPLSIDFIDRIYTRTYPESTLRVYVLDCIKQIKKEGLEDLQPYIEIAKKHDDLVADMLELLMGTSEPRKEVTDKTVEQYLMFGLGNEDVRSQDKGKGNLEVKRNWEDNDNGQIK